MTKKNGPGPNAGKSKTIYVGIAPNGRAVRHGAFFAEPPETARMYVYSDAVNWKVSGVVRTGDEWEGSPNGRWIDCRRLMPGELDANEWTLKAAASHGYQTFRHKVLPIELYGRTLKGGRPWTAARIKPVTGSVMFLHCRDGVTKRGTTKPGPVRTFATAAAAAKAALAIWTDEIAAG
jgi:hypothetical protein